MQDMTAGGGLAASACPACGVSLRAGGEFCTACGSEVPRQTLCRSCGAPGAAGSRFCQACGASLQAVVPPRPSAVSLSSAPSSSLPPRHVALTIFLWLVIVVNALVGIVSIPLLLVVAGLGASAGVETGSAMAVAGLGLLAVFFNVACGVAILRWKKWGFYGLVITSALGVVLNLAVGENPLRALLGLVGVGILFGLLQLGGAHRGWDRLK